MIPGRAIGLAYLMQMARRRLLAMVAAFAAASVVATGVPTVVAYLHPGVPAAQNPVATESPVSDPRAAAQREIDIASEIARRFNEDLERTTHQLDEQEQALSALQPAPSTQIVPLSPATVASIRETQARLQALTESITRDRATLGEWQSLPPTVSEPPAAEQAKAAILRGAQLRLADLEDRLAPEHPDVLRQRRVIDELQVGDRSASAVPPSGLAASSSEEIARLADRVTLQENERRDAEAVIASLRARAASAAVGVADDGQRAERLRERDALRALAVALRERAVEARSAADAAREALPPAVAPTLPPAAAVARSWGMAQPRMMGWALAGALLFALVVGAVREGGDTRVYDEGDVQAATGAAPLATIGDITPAPMPAASDHQVSSLPAASSPTLIWHPRCPPRTVEQYRRLGHALRRLRAERQSRVIGVTSPLPGEGKTLTAVNIAVTLAESYRQRVLIVDADLRRPNVSALMSLPAQQEGLADWLRRDDGSDCPMIRLSSRLSVVPAGTAGDNPVPLLTSLRMAMLVASARADFEWVIVDTPPAGLICDAGALEGNLDGFLLLAAAGRTPCAQLRQAISMLGAGRVLGIVLNRVRRAEGADSDDYSSYYSRTRAS